MRGMRQLNGFKWMRHGHATDPFTSGLMMMMMTGSKTDGREKVQSGALPLFKNGVSWLIVTATESSDLGLAGFLGKGGVDSHGWHSRHTVWEKPQKLGQPGHKLLSTAKFSLSHLLLRLQLH